MRLALTGATVLPMDGPRLEHHTVLVDGATIVDVIASGGAIPSGYEVLDCSGRFVMPGLADMHCHLGDAEQDICYLANGITTIRDMFGGPLTLRFAASVARSERPGPHVIACSPICDGPVNGGARYPGVLVVDDATFAATLPGRFASDGYRAVKVYSGLPPGSFDAICAAARDAGLPVVGHVPAGISWEHAAASGMRSFEHLLEVETGHLVAGDLPSGGFTSLDGYMERFLELERALDRDAVRRVAAGLARDDVWNCPTLFVNDRIVDDLVDPDEPAFAYVPQAARDRWNSSRMKRPSSMSPERFVSAVEARNRMHRELVAILEQEGAPMLMGTDAGSNSTVPGFAVHGELEDMCEAGLSASRVLELATVEAGRFTGERFGAVRPGYRADLLVLDDDPTVRLRTLERPHAVVVNGFLLDRTTLDARLAERAANVDRVLELDPDDVGPMSTPAWFARR